MLFRSAIVPFAVGLWVVVASSFTLTGAQANPAVTFALLVRDNFAQHHLLIILAEFGGALLALLYILLLDSGKKNKK